VTPTTRRAVLVVAVVLLAGCSASLPGTPTGSSGDVDLQTRYEPDYDAQAVLERVERIRGLNATSPVTVVTYGPRTAPEIGGDPVDSYAGIRPAGARTLQLYSTASPESHRALGYVDDRFGEATVHLLRAGELDDSDPSQELVLAHELAHVLQYQHGLSTLGGPSESVTDRQLARVMLVEGQASLVEQRYATRHLTGGVDPAVRNDSGTRAGWEGDLVSVAYYEGYRAARAADGWAERDERMREPKPSTTTELLHPGRNVSGPGEPVPAPSVADTAVRGRDRVGELAVRFTLRTNGVRFTEAAAAAAGWRNDSMVYYDDVDATYWGTRWANGSEATEFADAWRGMLDRRGATTDGGLLVVPGTDTTPKTYYAVERSGAVVHLAAGQNRTAVERIAGEW
jgi:hypothetical protein